MNLNELSKRDLVSHINELASEFETICLSHNLDATDVYKSKGYFSGSNPFGFKHPAPVFQAAQELLRANTILGHLISG